MEIYLEERGKMGVEFIQKVQNIVYSRIIKTNA